MITGFGAVVRGCDEAKKSAVTAPLYKQPMLSRWEFDKVSRHPLDAMDPLA